LGRRCRRRRAGSITWMRYDMNVAPLTAWKMYKAIPGAKFEVFEESGHLPSYEEPEKYVRVLEEFLR
jgi:proline iminopeptidase